MMSPTAPLLLALASLFAGSYGQNVQQPVTHLSVLQGEYVQLNCTHSGADYLYWYVQYPNKPLELLVNNLGQKSNGEFTVKIEKKDFHLCKGEAKVTDSAVYFCAASDTVLQSDLTLVT
ncbi:hypothetical protein XELAEV_18007218mg [Xenopus laevis]|uniref:Ig-like domain-containing protein n=1 Tax=Xenopus laevis TaxID=8355 RepID=A0A974E0R2_XENLA|nr:hypothetical protein XELAEV_18007218mg [Xenopus laevis]